MNELYWSRLFSCWWAKKVNHEGKNSGEDKSMKNGLSHLIRGACESNHFLIFGRDAQASEISFFVSSSVQWTWMSDAVRTGGSLLKGTQQHNIWIIFFNSNDHLVGGGITAHTLVFANWSSSWVCARVRHDPSPTFDKSVAVLIC